MRIETFVRLYNTKKTDEERIDLVKERMNEKHVSFSDKVNHADIIAKHCYYQKEKDANGVEREVFKQNSAAKYMFYSLTVVELYTDLDVDFKKALEQFEMLNGEILDDIMNLVDQRELKEFQMILDFACDDIITNEYELHSFIGKEVERFGNLVGATLAPILQSLDMDKVEEMIAKLNN